jgi:hypothetical protein
VPFADPAPDDGWTTSFENIKCYDQLHVAAVLNQIDGYNHDRTAKVGVPMLFGTNFQAVSVGEKLAVDPVTGLKGGYTNVLGRRIRVAGELDFIDQSMDDLFRAQGAAVVRFDPDHRQCEAWPVADRRDAAARHRRRSAGGHHRHRGCIRHLGRRLLIWLTDPSLAPGVVATLSMPANQQALGIQEIFAGQSLRNKFNNPGADPRTPDIILSQYRRHFHRWIEAVGARRLQRGRCTHGVAAVAEEWIGPS